MFEIFLKRLSPNFTLDLDTIYLKNKKHLNCFTKLSSLSGVGTLPFYNLYHLSLYFCKCVMSGTFPIFSVIASFNFIEGFNLTTLFSYSH